jgi:Icc-related predicted phosphoesterase
MTKIVMISDTHGLHNQITVPDGDLLIHAGDMSMGGTIQQIEEFANWFGRLPHRRKIIIAGNHDFLFEKKPSIAETIIRSTNAVYLNDTGYTFEGLKFWGSPVQPWFCNWAFNRQRGAEIKKHWDLIPNDTDVLITHGPPRGIGDQAEPEKNSKCLGCDDLFDTVESNRLDLKLHVFGHIHGGSGIHQFGQMKFVNASVLDEQYKPNNKQFIVEL